MCGKVCKNGNLTSQKSCKVCKNAKWIVTTLEPYGFRCPETQYVCNLFVAFALTLDSYGFRFPEMQYVCHFCRLNDIKSHVRYAKAQNRLSPLSSHMDFDAQKRNAHATFFCVCAHARLVWISILRNEIRMPLLIRK